MLLLLLKSVYAKPILTLTLETILISGLGPSWLQWPFGERYQRRDRPQHGAVPPALHPELSAPTQRPSNSTFETCPKREGSRRSYSTTQSDFRVFF